MKSKLRTAQNTQAVRRTRIQPGEIKDELKKSPDMQLYALTAAPHQRERMERLLEKLPTFRRWRRLSLSQRIEGAAQPVEPDQKF